MAFFDTSLPADRRPLPGLGLRGLLDTPFDRRSRDIARRAADLRRLSDDELAELGLTRGDILRHVLLSRGS
ncbi:hypothetical protein [Roseivivax sediminis]|uniref:DUF1127 domain-containing protein n=1 Tax=Roseivivax sediminis TaxID=936889 RepID=A0A1I1YP98_9RHOB|nr:hypothetical protein [Roseivivax sediminis]SFE21425.1 hypothetical protein SAMN04515678_107141 [Roseivivax sediminis]